MGLLLDGTYHMNHIKKGSAHTLQGIVNTFDDYEKALKNTLLNKSAIESPNNKFVDVTLKGCSKGLMYSPCTLLDYAVYLWQNIKLRPSIHQNSRLIIEKKMR